MATLKIKIVLLLLFSFCLQAQIKSSGLIILDDAMSLQLDLNNQNSKVYLTLSGPSDRWFALGFNSKTMGTSSVDVDCVVMTSATALTDSYIHSRSTPVADVHNNWTITNNTVSNSVRTIKAYRDFVSSDTSDFKFTNSLNALDVIFSYSYYPSNYVLSGHGDYRGAVSLSLSSLNTIENNTISYDLAMYPNPVKDELTIVPTNISFPEIEITVYNSNFQLILHKTYSTLSTKEIKIPFYTLPEGIYFIQSKIDSFESFQKIIVKK